MMRAAHLLLDGEPKIFSDHFASKLAGFESEAQLKVGLERFLAAVTADAGRETAEVTFRYLRAGLAQSVHRGRAGARDRARTRHDSRCWPPL